MTGHIGGRTGTTTRESVTEHPLHMDRPGRLPRSRAVLSTALGHYRPHSTTVIRVSVGLIFIWFGAMKFVPSASPAEDVATRTMDILCFGLVPMEATRPLLALFETTIGVGLLTGILLRPVLVAFFLHMAGTFSALLFLPGEMWDGQLATPTLEGQYVIKNVVLIAACLAVAADERLARPARTAERTARAARHRRAAG
ncbi:DoxX family protein [Streptomyces sp. CAU 1734]|uniref:DoxX family protein n=1 Tax=Streptomyces sp. CAU 1734 TaxID=3140360 RepID=UPI00325FFBDD